MRGLDMRLMIGEGSVSRGLWDAGLGTAGFGRLRGGDFRRADLDFGLKLTLAFTG